jgi:hypothetical protein
MRSALLTTSLFLLVSQVQAAPPPAPSVRSAPPGTAAPKIAPKAVPSASPKTEAPKFSAFTVGTTRCDASRRNVILPLSGEVELPAQYARVAKLTFDIAVNGALQNLPTVVPVLRRASGAPYARVEREVTLTSARAEAQVRLYVDSVATGQAQSVASACLTAKPNVTAITSKIQWPDLAPGPIVMVEYDPPQPISTRRACAICAPSLGPGRELGILPSSIIASDLTRTLDFRRLVAGACPATGDASVTLRFWVSIVAKGVDPAAYFAHETFSVFVPDTSERTTRPAGYFDTRSSTPQVSPSYRQIPLGYEWAAFDRILSCGRNGIFEFTLDPGNELREENESNNTVRVRYRITR